MEIKKFIKEFRMLPCTVMKISCLTGYFADPKGFGYLNLLFENAGVPKKYRHMFFPNEDGAVFIDCGMNVGWITDIARYMNMEVYGFEPNPAAVNLILNKKYADDNKVHIYPYAVSDKEGEIDFYADPAGLFDQGATIIKQAAKYEGGGRLENAIKVNVKQLTKIIQEEILTKHKHIHLLKIDIEGAEFGVVNDIIDKKLYDDITYIVVETHEGYFENGKSMLKNLKKRIGENNINNIYLDWI